MDRLPTQAFAPGKPRGSCKCHPIHVFQPANVQMKQAKVRFVAKCTLHRCTKVTAVVVSLRSKNYPSRLLGPIGRHPFCHHSVCRHLGSKLSVGTAQIPARCKRWQQTRSLSSGHRSGAMLVVGPELGSSDSIEHHASTERIRRRTRPSPKS